MIIIDESKRAILYTINLIKASLTDKELKKELDSSAISNIMSFASFHKIENIIINAFKKTPSAISVDIMEGLEKIYDNNIIVHIYQTQNYEFLKEQYEENRIVFVPLKGTIIKSLYPEEHLRQMADIDILTDDKYTPMIKDIMDRNGYRTLFYKEGMHDEYILPPATHIEIHRKLMTDRFAWKTVCDDIENNVLNGPDTGYERRMSDEDFYLYMIAHIAKHIESGGIGIRAVIDIWLYLDKYENELDWQYINRALDKGGMTGVNSALRQLVDVWFKSDDEYDFSDLFGNYILTSGWSGTHKNVVSEQAAQGSAEFRKKKIEFYIKKIFCTKSHLIRLYPGLANRGYMFPYYWLKRAVTIIFRKKELIESALNNYNDVNIDYGNDLIEIKKSIGLR